ncbi:C40 family peptidase [Planomonospora sp. ID67723]|uniref:C40 family peptidase n=1 Tax=Planomonospora sp. ID67723 TaxID=2738134 RepID=UPI0018C41407|nr:C40 family peptidase [Planomonospora sp. ID67723]MBG0828196.1 C40 family peptidase [Planomonospora sp. ID67723]
MITAFVAAAVLAMAAPDGVHAMTTPDGAGVAEARRSCPPVLSRLPEGLWSWLPEGVRALIVTDCGAGRPGSSGFRPAGPPGLAYGPADAHPPYPGPYPKPSPEEERAAEPRRPQEGPRPGSRPATGSTRPQADPVPRPAADPARPGPRTETNPSRPARLSPGRIAVAAALRRLGTPYVWGGGSSTGPTRGGFDCSGLALHAWSKAGAVLTHYTGDQFRQGRRVPFSRLRPGDLVFFGGGTGAPTHVGLYVKNGVMVHAPKTGDVVKTTDFASSPYYRARYRGAVRPSPR